MSWLEIAALTVLFVGIGAGGYLVAQRPSFWWGLGAVAFKAALPFLMKRMTPAQEKAFQDCVRRGGEWDHIRKKCK
jgi:4-hydroxybenzoate polyprenyltransferase